PEVRVPPALHAKLGQAVWPCARNSRRCFFSTASRRLYAPSGKLRYLRSIQLARSIPASSTRQIHSQSAFSSHLVQTCPGNSERHYGLACAAFRRKSFSQL